MADIQTKTNENVDTTGGTTGKAAEQAITPPGGNEQSSAAGQFQAVPGQTYSDGKTTVSFTADQLKTPGIGMLASNYKPTTAMPAGFGSGSAGNTSGTTSYNDYYNQAGSLLKDISTPMTAESIAASKTAKENALQDAANKIYDPLAAERRARGELELGGAQAKLGQTRGLGFSSAELGYMGAVQSKIDTSIKEIANAKAEYLSKGMLALADKADEQLWKLYEANTNLDLKKVDIALNMKSEDRQAAESAVNQKVALGNLDLNTLKTLSDIPVGQKVTIGGVSYEGLKPAEKVQPFFSGSNITTLMQNLEKGKTQVITDPNTKENITIVGMNTDNPNVMTVEDNQGRIRGIDKSSGRVLWKTEAGVGTVARTGGGGGASTKETPEEKAFRDDLGKSIAAVTQDPNNWGKEWNYLYSRYRGDLEASAKAAGMTVNDVLDQLMNKQMNFPKTTEQNGGGSGAFNNVINWAQSFATNGSTPATK